MTREQFIERATRAAERSIAAPPGWWGTWRDVRGPDGQRVHFSTGVWQIARASVSRPGKWIRISRHDSRAFAIRKARTMPTGAPARDGRR
jgi:hypothetical protein